MYNLICIIGKSGSGKDTIFNRILIEGANKNLPLHQVIGCTTRPKREGEINGVNYNFLTVEQFTDKLLKNELIEAVSFNDWFYGTEHTALKEDKVNIGIFDPERIYTIMESAPEIKLWVYYIDVKDKTRLLRQLNREKEPDVQEIIRRFQTDDIDFYHLDFYYSILENETMDDLQNATQILINDINTIYCNKIKKN